MRTKGARDVVERVGQVGACATDADQFQSVFGSSEETLPPMKLLTAMLIQARKDLHSRHPAIHVSAWAWIMTRRWDHYGFDGACTQLGLDPDYTRRGLLAQIERKPPLRARVHAHNLLKYARGGVRASRQQAAA